MNNPKLFHNAEQLKVATTAVIDELVATIETLRRSNEDLKDELSEIRAELEEAHNTISNIQNHD